MDILQVQKKDEILASRLTTAFLFLLSFSSNFFCSHLSFAESTFLKQIQNETSSGAEFLLRNEREIPISFVPHIMEKGDEVSSKAFDQATKSVCDDWRKKTLNDRSGLIGMINECKFEGGAWDRVNKKGRISQVRSKIQFATPQLIYSISKDFRTDSFAKTVKNCKDWLSSLSKKHGSHEIHAVCLARDMTSKQPTYQGLFIGLFKKPGAIDNQAAAFALAAGYEEKNKVTLRTSDRISLYFSSGSLMDKPGEAKNDTSGMLVCEKLRAAAQLRFKKNLLEVTPCKRLGGACDRSCQYNYGTEVVLIKKMNIFFIERDLSQAVAEKKDRVCEDWKKISDSKSDSIGVLFAMPCLNLGGSSSGAGKRHYYLVSENPF